MVVVGLSAVVAVAAAVVAAVALSLWWWVLVLLLVAIAFGGFSFVMFGRSAGDRVGVCEIGILVTSQDGSPGDLSGKVVAFLSSLGGGAAVRQVPSL